MAAVAAVALLLLVAGRAVGSGVPHIHNPPWLWTDLKPIGDGSIAYEPCDPYLVIPPEWSYGVENWDAVMASLMDFDQHVCSSVEPPVVHIRWEEAAGHQCLEGVYGCWTFPEYAIPPPWFVGIIVFDYDIFASYTSAKKTAGAAHEWGHIMDLASVDQQNCDQPYRVMGGNQDGACILGPSGLEAWTVADLHGWSAEDDDGDAFSDAVEMYPGTDPMDSCPDNFADAAWPLDVNNDRVISACGDILNYRGRIAAVPGSPKWWQRLDLNVDGGINSSGDLNMYRGKIAVGCS